MSERIDKLLQPHRDEIRELDEQIATLLIKRHIITDEIGRIKREHGVPSFQPQQHEKVLEHLRNLAVAQGTNNPERLIGDYTDGILTQSVESQESNS